MKNLLRENLLGADNARVYKHLSSNFRTVLQKRNAARIGEYP